MNTSNTSANLSQNGCLDLLCCVDFNIIKMNLHALSPCRIRNFESRIILSRSKLLRNNLFEPTKDNSLEPRNVPH